MGTMDLPGMLLNFLVLYALCTICSGFQNNERGLDFSIESSAIAPSFAPKVFSKTGENRQLERTTNLGTPFIFKGAKDSSKKKPKKYHRPTEYLTYPEFSNHTLSAHEDIRPTRITSTPSDILFRQKRCFTCGPMDGSDGGMGNNNMVMGNDNRMGGMGAQDFNRIVIQPAQVQQVQQGQQQLLIQGADGQLTSLGAGTYTFAGAMQTSVSNGYTFTLSSYTQIIDGRPTVGVVTLVPMHTYYNNRLLQPGENAYGVPNQGSYTLPGSMSVFQSQGYPYTVSSFTKIIDGAATYGAMTLAGMQTYFNNRLLRPDENPYGVPNVGTYTLPGNMQTIYLSGYPNTVSTYTKIVDGVATFGTVTLGGMQTYYAGKLLAPGENPYGVPNVGTYTLPGQVSQFNDENGYPVTVSSYTKIIDGRATFGAMTQGMKATYYNGKILRFGENPYGVPNEGTYTLAGNVNRLLVNGQEQTLSTYTRIVNGVATYGTVTQMQMQTVFVPAGQQFVGNRAIIPVMASNGGNSGMMGSSSGQQMIIRQVIPAAVIQNGQSGGNFGQFSCALMGK